MAQVIEYIVISIIAIGGFIGLFKGFMRIFFSWFSVFISILVSMKFTSLIVKHFLSGYQSNILIIFLVAVVLFAATYIIIMQFAVGLTHGFRTRNLGVLDFLLGGVFGAVQMMIFVGLAVYWMQALNWVDMTPYPASMFSLYFAEKIILLIGTQVNWANKLL